MELGNHLSLTPEPEFFEPALLLLQEQKSRLTLAVMTTVMAAAHRVSDVPGAALSAAHEPFTLPLTYTQFTVLGSFYTRGNGGSERCGNRLKVTRPAGGGVDPDSLAAEAAFLAFHLPGDPSSKSCIYGAAFIPPTGVSVVAFLARS